MGRRELAISTQIVLVEAYVQATRVSMAACAKSLGCGDMTFRRWAKGETRMPELFRSFMLRQIEKQNPELKNPCREAVNPGQAHPIPVDILQKLQESLDKEVA